MLQALGRLAQHDMLSANAANLWWVIGYLLRVRYSMHDMGLWAAVTAPAKILGIQRVIEIGYPDPRAHRDRPLPRRVRVGALDRLRRTPDNPAIGDPDLWLLAGLAAFLVHAYATLSAQVHENHLFAAVPLLVLAAAGRRAFLPICVGVSVVVALNLNLFYGLGDGVGYALPRAMTIVDAHRARRARQLLFAFMARGGLAATMLHGSRTPPIASASVAPSTGRP